jgi:lipid-A-disaccharide synthase
MRIFVSTGEASGDFNAAALAQAIRRIVPDARFEGIGSERMRAAGFTLTANTRGWASMGPLAALAKIPPLYAIMWRHALRLRARPPDVIVLVDFGVFNLRLAKTLRMIGYRGPIVYYFPPGAWLDRYTQAHAVARYTQPLTAFAHQRDYYRWLGLEVAYFGHPLASLIAPRPPRPAPPPDGGSVALLPGSRKREIERHLPRLLAAFAQLKRARPALRGTIGASDADSEDLSRQLLGQAAAGEGLGIVRGSDAALAEADVAWIASGTAVLEAALREVPSVALYVVSEPEIEIGRRMWHGPCITLPNILLGRELIPELLQEAASPARLAEMAAALLDDPTAQLDGVREMRALLGPADALDRCAGFVLDRAKVVRAA